MIRHFRNAALLALAATSILVLGGCGSTATRAPATGTGAASPSGSSGSAPATTQAPVAPTTPTPITDLPAGYLPLYPFDSLADALAWQASTESGGHQPWHLSPDSTAIAFAAFLGYTEVTEVVRSTVSGADAHVAVGIKPPEGRLVAAAVIHLVRFGAGEFAPWEVVGTDDTTFTLDRPAYGSSVSSPVTVGGKITGVDESIRVTVHTLSVQGPVGSHCCEMAGGAGYPWTARVTFRAVPGEVVTIAASTGGHLATVERFTVTGVRVSLGKISAGALQDSPAGRPATPLRCYGSRQSPCDVRNDAAPVAAPPAARPGL